MSLEVIILIDPDPIHRRHSEMVLEHRFDLISTNDLEEIEEIVENRHVDGIVMTPRVEDDFRRRIYQLHEEQCPRARLIETNEDPDHLITHIEKEFGYR